MHTISCKTKKFITKSLVGKKSFIQIIKFYDTCYSSSSNTTSTVPFRIIL